MSLSGGQAGRLRDLIAETSLVVAPGAFDSLTAKLVERAGFGAVYMTGFGATASRLGGPDIGLLTQTEMTTHARDMVRAVGLPVIADADTGYGGPGNIERTVQEYVQAGVAAIHLEDQISPKRCGQMAGIRLEEADVQARRLAGAVAARDASGDLMLIARTDALPVMGIDAAADRAKRYQDAGVDLVFVDGVKTRDDVEGIAAKVSGPKVISLVDGTDAAGLAVDTLREMGFSLAFYAVTGLFAAVQAVSGALQRLHGNGTVPATSLSYQDYCEIVGLSHFQDLDDRYGT